MEFFFKSNEKRRDTYTETDTVRASEGMRNHFLLSRRQLDVRELWRCEALGTLSGGDSSVTLATSELAL